MGTQRRDAREDFEERYASIFGSRWPVLRERLLEARERCIRLNGFLFGREDWFRNRPTVSFKWAPECLRDWSEAGFEDAPQGLALEAGYLMDPASVAVALALEVNEGMKVLDLCAAPGGKTLILAERMGEFGHLVANELSRSRRFKLLDVLNRYVPDTVLRRVEVRSWEGSGVGLRHPEQFDRVLVDAPCSAEGHLLQHPRELDRWSAARSRQLARRQYALLCSALLATRPGGRVVYATCSVSPTENDGVIERLLHRKGEMVRRIPYRAPLGEQTAMGWCVLPDRERAGPAYFAVLEKI